MHQVTTYLGRYVRLSNQPFVYTYMLPLSLIERLGRASREVKTKITQIDSNVVTSTFLLYVPTFLDKKLIVNEYL